MRADLLLTVVVVLLGTMVDQSQGGPRSASKKLQPTELPKMAAGTALPGEEQGSSSEEDDDSTSEEGDEDNLNIEGKTGKLCAKHPSLAAMESECMAEYESMKKAKCNSTESTVMDVMKEKVVEGLQTVKNATLKAVEKVKEMVGMSDANVTESSASNTTHKHGHRRRSCHFYQCMLKKMNALDETTKMPDEDKVLKWVSEYVRDDGRAKMEDGPEPRIKRCFSELRKNGVILSASDIEANAANTTMESSMPVTYVVHVPGACPRCKELSCVVYADGNPGKNECNAYSKLWMCLAEVESSECAIFMFP